MKNYQSSYQKYRSFVSQLQCILLLNGINKLDDEHLDTTNYR